MEYKKVPQQINDVVGDNVKKLAQLFPSAVKDGTVDFEALKEELGQFEEVSSEKYELTWAGKKNAKKIAQEDVVGRTLQFIPEDSRDADTTENLYIEGENLEVLKLLRQNYYSSVQTIYIDPPYNTGNDFIYNDSFDIDYKLSEISEGNMDEFGNRYVKKQRSTNRFHSKWLCNLYCRIKVCKDLLSEEGLLFVSIGQNEVANLISICDEIFGEENRVGICSRIMKSGGGKGQYFSPNIDYVFVYAKNITNIEKFRVPTSEKTLKSYYKNVEIKGERKGQLYGEERIYVAGLDARPNQRYWIECPDGTYVIPPNGKTPPIVREGEKITPEKGDGCWKWTYETYYEQKKLGNIVFKETSTSALVDQNGNQSKYNLYNKVWLDDKEGSVPGDLISDFENRQSSAELKALNIPFDFAKPVKLIKYLLCFRKLKNELVLDFFSGSGTTAEAVMQLNAEDGGTRRFIMVQFPENLEEKSNAYLEGYRTICDIGRERIRRAGDIIKKEHVDVDTGYKVFRVSDTNIKWNSLMDIGQLDTSQIETTPDLVDFVPGANEIDIVYELMLRQRDVPLSETLELLSDIGNRTYLYASSFLVCLETEITGDLISKLAELDPLPIKFIFRDSAFKDDIALKDETFRRLKALVEKNAGANKSTYTVEFI